jgi:hypothetical protein
VETNTATGQVEWASVGRYAIGSRSSQSGIWDNDFAPLSTSYRVDMVVVSTATGQIVAQAGANVTTPGLKLGS